MLKKPTVVALAATCLFITAVHGEDWPCFRKDARRSAASSEQLVFPLVATWIHHGATPRPAWPEPGRTVNWFDFDYAYQPVAAAGLVVFGSSADDTVYALKAADGQLAWSFTTDAPLRFAPQLVDGMCYFASDDGAVYCVNLQTGGLVWNYRSNASNRMISGNGRMISRWPCRSGVLVIGDTLYATAGMWASEGTYFFALDRHTGKVRWCNDTCSADYSLFPHDGVSFGGPTPQGDLLSDGKILLVPTGQSAPAAFDLESGKFLYWDTRAPGSTCAALGDECVMVPARAWQGDQDTRLGEADLWESDGIAFYGLRDGTRSFKPKWSQYDKLPGSTRGGMGRLRGMIEPIGGRDRMVFSNNILYTSGMGMVDAVDASGKEIKSLWQQSAPRVYCLALAGNCLIVGCDGEVRALKTGDGKTVWSAPVSGQARGIAVANGQLIVSTDHGVIYNFGRQAGNPLAAESKASAVPAPKLPADFALDPDVKGYGLVCGAADTTLAEALAAASHLNVTCLLPDAATVARARQHLSAAGTASHVVVHQNPRDGQLPYADYFANVVVVCGNGGGINPEQLYRVLHPSTGKMYFPGAAAATVAASLQAAGIPPRELLTTGGVPTVVRGPLEGAFDWNSTYKTDQRLKWPLELLWFGGPGRDRMLRRHGRYYPPPIPAAGRVFLEGESHVIATDAYNGTELWSWYVPGFRSINADDKNVYIGARNLLQCDARSGEILKVFGDPKPFVFDLSKPQAFDAKKGNKYSGRITVQKSPQGLELLLETHSPTPYSADCWMLDFDFRNTPQRLRPPAAGAFSIIINTTSATLRNYAQPVGVVLPKLTLSRGPDPKSPLVLRISTEEITRLAGHVVANFDLRAELLLYESGKEAPRRWLREMPLTGTREFLQEGPGAQDMLQNGSATFVLSGDTSSKVSPVGIVARADRKAAPSNVENWGKLPYFVRHDGNIPRLPVAADVNPSLGGRTDPFSGLTVEQKYQRGYGCSGTISSMTMDFFRSGTLGMYDLEDDSGMRNFPGMKPGCGVSLLPALGVLFSGEANADCFCPYNFSTSLALAPAATRKNEDWALYFDTPKNANVKRAALNLGAPGDRRDENRTLWLGYPRAPLMEDAAGPEKRPHTFGMPLAMTLFDGGRAFRVNGDRTPIQGTKTPWIYASQMLGIQSLSLGLVYYDPKKDCLAFPSNGAVHVDARFDEPTWAGDSGITVRSGNGKATSPNARMRVRFDETNLYFAYQEDPPSGKTGSPAWRTTIKNDQGNIWGGDQVSVILKDKHHSPCAQFGVAAGGAHYSADVSWRLRIPPVSGLTIDGKPGDWGQQGVVLLLAEGRGTLRLGWTPQGLAILTTMPRDFFSVQKDWNALRTQIIGAGPRNILETVVRPEDGSSEALRPTLGRDSSDSVDMDDWKTFRADRKADLPLASAASGTDWVTEVLFPWDQLAIRPVAGARCGLKLVAFNPKAGDQNIAAGGGSRRDIVRGEMLPELELAAAADGIAIKPPTTRREFYGAILLYDLPPQEIPVAQWSAAVTADGESFRAEMAVPRKLLTALGLTLDDMNIAIRPNGKAAPSYASLSSLMSPHYSLTLAKAAQAGRTFMVRLHFAELDDVKPGERVFGIRMQGRTVEPALDVVKEAGGPRRALTRIYKGVPATTNLSIEFVPQAKTLTSHTLPLLSGVEIVTEQSD